MLAMHLLQWSAKQASVDAEDPALESRAAFGYISLKFLVGMTKSGSTRSRSFLLPADRLEIL